MDQNLLREVLQHSPVSLKLFQESLAFFKETQLQVSHLNQNSAFDLRASQSERSTSYFFRPVDASLRNVPIDSILLPSGSESSDPSVISRDFVDHWVKIFGDTTHAVDSPDGNSEAAQAHLLRSIEKRLSTAQSSKLCESVTAADLTESIKHMKSGSSPGLDGLSAAFYKTDPDVFGEILSIVFNYQLARGTLLPSQRKSCVVLLYKKGPRPDPGNYRPIALMQVDIEILSKSLVYRLRELLDVLVHTDQARFIAKRSLHYHVRLLKDLRQFISSRNLEGFALFLDFEKAYGRVGWTYIESAFLRMNCSSAFVNWVRLLYNNPVAKLQLNASLHGSIRPTRGVKQGDPLSCFLFLLCTEPLGQLLRQAPAKGICLLSGKAATGLYFADNSTVLSSSLENLRDQLDLVRIYCDGSGARLNLQKSALMALNRIARCQEMHQVQTLSASETITHLGIPFS